MLSLKDIKDVSFYRKQFGNEVCWVCKRRSVEAKNWPVKWQISSGTREAKFSLGEGKNPLDLLQRGVYMLTLTRCSSSSG